MGSLIPRIFLLVLFVAALPTGAADPTSYSGIYPHLAVFNDTGSQQDNECGIGAVVPWAGRLWLLTYPPHGERRQAV